MVRTRIFWTASVGLSVVLVVGALAAIGHVSLPDKAATQAFEQLATHLHGSGEENAANVTGHPNATVNGVPPGPPVWLADEAPYGPPEWLNSTAPRGSPTWVEK